MERRSLIINPADEVAVLLENGEKGDTITVKGKKVFLLEPVEFAHKVAIQDIPKGKPVIKYGEEIGYALTDIPAGAWIHRHNMGCDRGKKMEKKEV